MNNNSIAFTLGRNSYNNIPSIKYKILIKMNNWQLTLHNENYKMKIQQQTQRYAEYSFNKNSMKRFPFTRYP